MRVGKNILPSVSILLILGALTSCAMQPATGRVLYQEGRTFVRLEADPDVGGVMNPRLNTHPVGIESTQLAKLLQGIGIRPEQGFLSQLLSLATPAEPVFNFGDLALLAPILARGLAEAGPSERIAFSLARTQPGRRTGALSGYVSVQDPYLKFVLQDHPTVGWQDPEDPSSPKLFDLDFLREGFLWAGSEGERKGSYRSRPAIQVDYRGYLSSLEEKPMATNVSPIAPAAPAAVPPPAPQVGAVKPKPAVLPPPLPVPGAVDAKSVTELQKQVKELTDANQELRATLKDMLERQAQTQPQLAELNRIRQELAETKQLLADKVLELNKLKSKSSKPGKEKVPAAPSR